MCKLCFACLKHGLHWQNIAKFDMDKVCFIEALLALSDVYTCNTTSYVQTLVN